MRRTTCCYSIVALIAIGFSSIAPDDLLAQTPVNSIAFSFFNPADGATGPLFVGPPNSPATNLAAGVLPVRQDFWNDLAGGPNNGSGLQTALQDRFGTPTSLTVQWFGSDVSSQSYIPAGAPGAGDSQMMNGTLINALGPTTQLDVSLVPASFLAAGYDVYVYADREFINNQESVRIEVGGNAIGSFALQDVKSDFTMTGPATFGLPDYDDATMDGVGNFVRFENLSAPNFSIIADAGGAISYINGVQIVSREIPEPATLLLTSLLLCVAAPLRQRP